MSSDNKRCVNCHETFDTPDSRKLLVCNPLHFDTARRWLSRWVIKKMSLNPREEFLDIGCGVLRVGLPIISYLDSDRYYGYDLCANRIEEAKQELCEYGLDHKEPVLTTDWNEVGRKKFKKIWCYQVLIHVPDSELHVTVQRIKDVLEPDGTALVSVNVDVDQHPLDGQWREYPFLCRRLDFYEEAFGKAGLSVEQLEEWTPEGGERILKVSHFK